MPLTPAEVRAVQFSTKRMRAGYDMDEVDAFLDIVEADIGQLADDLQRSRDGEAVLRTQCDQLQQRLLVAEQRLAERPADPVAPVLDETPTTVLPAIDEQVREAIEADADAAAIVAVAQRTADEIVRFAQVRADAIRASVRTMLDEQRALLEQD